jgi:hypothetical protein
MSLNDFQGKLWAMREIAKRAEAERRLALQIKKPAVILKLQSRKPVRRSA